MFVMNIFFLRVSCVVTWSDSRSCTLAHCQYGCEEVQGEIRCLCPSAGLQLGPDGKTCVGENISTISIVILKITSQLRLKLFMIFLKITDELLCLSLDIDECTTGKNQCPFNRQCTNTFGSYYCKCQSGHELNYINGKYDCEGKTNTLVIRDSLQKVSYKWIYVHVVKLWSMWHGDVSLK